MYFNIIKPKVVLFDWDNTIVATHSLFSNVLSAVHDKLNLDKNLFESQVYKDTRNMSVRDSFPKLFGEKWQEVWVEYQKCYHQVLDARGGVMLLENADVFLKQLHIDGVLLGVVSNKDHDLLKKEIDQLQLTTLFSSIVGSGKADEDKPSAIHALCAIEELMQTHKDLTINSEYDCWFVGDSDVDVSCAINAKCLPVLLNTPDKMLLSRRKLNENNIPHIDINNFNELILMYNKIK